MDEILKKLIDNKTEDIKHNLDKIIINDIFWLSTQCKSCDISKYLDYYMGKLKEYKIFEHKDNISFSA